MTRAHGAGPPPLTGGISASSSPASSGASAVRVLAVDGHDDRQVAGQVAELVDRVLHRAPSGSSIESSLVPARSRSCAKRRTVTCMVGDATAR